MARPNLHELVITKGVSSSRWQSGPRDKPDDRVEPFVSQTSLKSKIFESQRVMFNGKRIPNLRPLNYYAESLLIRPCQGTETVTGTKEMQDGWGLPYYPMTYVIRSYSGYVPVVADFPLFDYGPDAGKAQSRAISALLGNVKDQKFNGAQAFAEAKQTHKMIASIVTTVATTLTHLRKGNLVAAGEALGLTMGKRAATRYRRRHAGLKNQDDVDQMLASGILQVQYGIKPLMSDVIGLCETFYQKDLQDKNIHAKSSSTSYFKDVSVINSGSYKVVRTVSGSVRVKYGLTFSTSELSEIAHTASQLGLTNPAVLAWELLPWSFVIDWFLPIGNALQQLDATLGVQFVSGWTSVKVSHQEMTTQTAAKTDNNYYTNGGFLSWSINSSAVSVYDRKLFTRRVLTDFPAPRLPVLKSPLGLEHTLNAFALLAGFKSKTWSK